MAAGPSPFPAAEKDQNAAAAPDALKGSAWAWLLAAAPANAEERLLKGAASMAYNKIFGIISRILGVSPLQ